MTLNEMIAALEALKEKHGGDVDVTAWHYGEGWMTCASSSRATMESSTSW